MSFEGSGNNGVAYVECAVFDEISYMGCFTVLSQGETTLFGIVQNIHDTLLLSFSVTKAKIIFWRDI